ncbi:hypothetical protein GN956_G18791 [Arapaima gigas]
MFESHWTEDLITLIKNDNTQLLTNTHKTRAVQICWRHPQAFPLAAPPCPSARATRESRESRPSSRAFPGSSSALDIAALRKLEGKNAECIPLNPELRSQPTYKCPKKCLGEESKPRAFQEV